LPRETLEEALGQRIPDAQGAAVRAPGRLPSHYAPRAGVVLAEAEALEHAVSARLAQGQRVAVLAPSGFAALPPSIHLAVPSDVEGLARVLYAELRRADSLGVEVVVIATPRNSGVGAALLDRLARAAAPRSPPPAG
jgi:L-threonylcarbamoyladenylate synthase